MVKEINLAVIGAGYWGTKVAEEYIRLARTDHTFNLTKICDPEKSKLSTCKDVLNVGSEKLATDYKAIISDHDINAVHICTPNVTHYKIALQALKANKSVLLEKPMASSFKDALDLCAVAKSAHLCLQVGHIFRFNNALKKLRELINEGYFGNLYYLKLQWTTLMTSPLGRDVIFDLGPHPVDIINFLLERWPSKVSCNAKAYRRRALAEVAYIVMEFGEKTLAHVELSWLEPGKIRELNIIGSKRSARVDCLNQWIKIFEEKKDNSFKVDIPVNNTIFDEISHFVRSIRDENNHKNPGSVGAANMAVLEGLKKSMVEQRMVRVDMKKKMHSIG